MEADNLLLYKVFILWCRARAA